MTDNLANTKMPEHPMDPFIRILGESLSRDVEVGQELNWRIVTHTVAPQGIQSPLVRHVWIYDEKEQCVFDAPPLRIESRESDLERFDNQHVAMDCEYEPVIDVKELGKGCFTVSARLETESGELISQCRLPVKLDRAARLVGRINLCWEIADDDPDRLYLGGIVRTGDVDGDGMDEIVHAVGTKHLCVYSRDGSVRWRYDDPDGVMVYNTAPMRLFDIDGDGKAEIICPRGPFGDLQLVILDGESGAIKQQVAVPFLREIEQQAAPFIQRLQKDPKDLDAWDGIAQSGHTVRFLTGGEKKSISHIYGAKVLVANFRGQGQKDLLLQLGDQNCVTLLAMDGDLNLLWHHRVEDGYAGHNPAIYDVDGDGRDEVAVGTRLLDHDGSLLWKKEFDEFAAPWEDDHIDQAQAGPFGPNGEMVIVYSCRVCVEAATGRTIWIDPTWHGQEVHAAKMLDDGNTQFVFYDREYRHSRHLCHGNWFDVRHSDGTKIWSYRHGALHAHRLLDWNGDGLYEVSFGLDLQRRPIRPNLGIFDGQGHLTNVLPWYGFGADVDGDGFDELVSWSQWPDVTNKIEIYELEHSENERGRASASRENPFAYNEPD